MKYYNLDAILSVSYRVISRNATQFLQWANKVLKLYLINGFLKKKTLFFHWLNIAYSVLWHKKCIFAKKFRVD